MFIDREKRKSISKNLRARIKTKTNGLCGYCGLVLPNRWHVDNVYPICNGGADNYENMVASCPQCNNYKSVFSVEQFRAIIEGQCEQLSRYSTNYKFAIKYELITVNVIAIIFYFEILGIKFKIKH